MAKVQIFTYGANLFEHKSSCLPFPEALAAAKKFVALVPAQLRHSRTALSTKWWASPSPTTAALPKRETSTAPTSSTTTTRGRPRWWEKRCPTTSSSRSRKCGTAFYFVWPAPAWSSLPRSPQRNGTSPRPPQSTTQKLSPRIWRRPVWKWASADAVPIVIHQDITSGYILVKNYDVISDKWRPDCSLTTSIYVP